MLNASVLQQFPLNSFVKQSKVKAALAFTALVSLIAFSSLSCGKRKPPLPPKERVSQRAELSGFQRGSSVVLSWKMPARNAGKGSVINISRVDIYRLAEPANSPLVLSEEEFASRSLLIGSLPVKDSDFGLKTMTYNDKLEFAGQPARLRYSVRFTNASGQKASFSNFLLIEPAAKVAAAPTSLSVEISQDAVKLNWIAPPTNVDGSTPPNLIGYDVYRSASEKETAKLLNKTPVKEPKFDDAFFDFGKDYFYFVRAVSVGTDAAPVESQESNIVKVKPVDTFAPSPPAAITLAAGQNVISIFFAINPEKDIAGYKIYRSTEPDAEKSTWLLLTRDILTKNTFQDTKVESGNTYYYFITATDKAGNVSQPSGVVSEIAP